MTDDSLSDEMDAALTREDAFFREVEDRKARLATTAPERKRRPPRRTQCPSCRANASVSWKQVEPGYAVERCARCGIVLGERAVSPTTPLED